MVTLKCYRVQYFEIKDPLSTIEHQCNHCDLRKMHLLLKSLSENKLTFCVIELRTMRENMESKMNRIFR